MAAVFESPPLTLYEDMELSLPDGLELLGENSAAGYKSSFFFLLGDRHMFEAMNRNG